MSRRSGARCPPRRPATRRRCTRRAWPRAGCAPRFRSSHRAAKPTKLARSVRRLTQALGPVRELDVELLILDEFEKAATCRAPAVQRLRARRLAKSGGGCTRSCSGLHRRFRSEKVRKRAVVGGAQAVRRRQRVRAIAKASAKARSRARPRARSARAARSRTPPVSTSGPAA